jgi:ferredoxin-NADP reductase
MLHQLAKSHTERGIWWLHGARGPREHPFAAEAHALLASLPHAQEHVFYSAATPAERHRVHAASGRLTKESLASLGIPANASAYVCGPASFMAGMRDALTTLGVDLAAIHTELFGALPSINPGLTGQNRRPPHKPPGPPGTGPQVTFARSGITVPFGNGRGSVLDLADACDVPTRWSCRTGVCHTCITPLLSGQITYSPQPLEPPPDGQVLICCARPGTDLVLDM